MCESDRLTISAAWLVEHVIRQGWRVTALHRPKSVLTHLKRYPVDLVAGDIEDREAIVQAMPEGLAAVFHVAADVSHWSRDAMRQERCNVEGTRNVVSAALARGARKFVDTSSIGVYGFQAGPFDETQILGSSANSWNNYARSKTLGEDEVQKGIDRGLDAVILNPANIIGAYDSRNWSRLFRMVGTDRLPGSAARPRLILPRRGGGQGSYRSRRLRQDRGKVFARRGRRELS